MKKLSVLLFVALFTSQFCLGDERQSVLFPKDNYAPYGYLDNPYHSYVLHKSGIIRSIPPLGYGFWCRRLPWPYGEGAAKNVNYLSFIEFAVNQDGIVLVSEEDFKTHGIDINSLYHSKNIMSYDWCFNDIRYKFEYFLASENTLSCIVTIKNESNADKQITLNATNTYGYPETERWGSRGITSIFNDDYNVAVSKMWAYGDIFVMGSNVKSDAYKATVNEEELSRWLQTNDTGTNNGAISRSPDPVYSTLTYRMNIPKQGVKILNFSLTRGKTEKAAIREYQENLACIAEKINLKRHEDNAFYENMPLLTGGWPESWRHGWIYDYETLRMNIRNPIGIYKHYWDAMQPFTPRCVLGETAIDAMCMSYADVEMAKDMLLGIFEDALDVNIPCSREDGSVNMIAADGKECGTSPAWGMPFLVIRSIYERTHDKEWIKAIYPHLKNFLKWWLDNRTDKDGFFHAANRWESGQDGSRRFLILNVDPSAAIDLVRTVDIEAVMAHAMSTMGYFARNMGYTEDVKFWEGLYPKRIKNVRSMFVDGWFRDFDVRTNEPIFLNYYDIMMFMPVSLNIVTDIPKEDLKPKFEHFRNNPRHYMEWPSLLFPFTEAAWNSGYTVFTAEEVAKIGNRVYHRTDDRKLHPVLIQKMEKLLPEKYSYRIPGVANEFWPLREDNPGGCENYGWGTSLPTLIIRNIIGFRELTEGNGFILSPSVPKNLIIDDYIGISNLAYRGLKINLKYKPLKGNKINVFMSINSDKYLTFKVIDKKGRIVYNSSAKKSVDSPAIFKLINGEKYNVIFQ